MTTPIELDGQTREQDGEVLSAYKGENAPTGLESETLPELTPDEMIIRYGHLAIDSTKPEIPQNIRDMASESRARHAKEPLEKFLKLQRERYSGPDRWN